MYSDEKRSAMETTSTRPLVAPATPIRVIVYDHVKALKGLASFEIIIALIILILTIVNVSLFKEYGLYVRGGITIGILGLFAGGLGVNWLRTGNATFVVSHFVMCIITMIQNLELIISSSIFLSLHNWPPGSDRMTAIITITWINLIMAVAQMLLTLFSIILISVNWHKRTMMNIDPAGESTPILYGACE